MPTQPITTANTLDVGGFSDPLGPADLSDLITPNERPILSIGDACSLSCSWCCWLSVTC